jgi:UDP-N-acetylglucosamine 2-epimerase (non-hydrolysing)/GDP/UDP-N,N'-diacetylbacillosamine 2-epimerase (hydrolysing)
MPLLSRQELADRFGIDLTCPSLLVTYHPVTLEQDRTEMQVKELLAALEELELGIVFTYPNADPKGRSIIDAILEFTGRRKHSKAVANLGTQAYFSLMSHAAAMVGNSSSGIVEAASFGLPVVNIGTRERGRVHGRNVLDVGYGRGEILQSIRRAVSPEFRASLEGLTNPYGDGHASEKIVARLKEVTLDSELLRKRFYEN